MDANALDLLNKQFAVPGHVRFSTGQGGLVMAVVENEYCTGAVTLAGGHVISYQPKNQAEVFWMSPNSIYEVGKPIRGGIPLCWPWFGPHAEDPKNLPMHGFARILPWSVKATHALLNGSTEVCLFLEETPQTLAWWSHHFHLELVLTFGEELMVDLVTRNTGTQAFTYHAAQHHYFRVADVRQVVVRGLEGTDYLDKVENFSRKQQAGVVTISAQTDRIYLDTLAECVIEDPGMGRSIHIQKEGSRTTVVWNPQERAAQMPDVGAGNETGFICVETANAADDAVEVLPGAEAHLTATIWPAP